MLRRLDDGRRRPERVGRIALNVLLVVTLEDDDPLAIADRAFFGIAVEAGLAVNRPLLVILPTLKKRAQGDEQFFRSAGVRRPEFTQRAPISLMYGASQAAQSSVR